MAFVLRLNKRPVNDEEGAGLLTVAGLDQQVLGSAESTSDATESPSRARAGGPEEDLDPRKKALMRLRRA